MEFKLPGYVILDKIGTGGMAVVYKARHESLNRTVAIKFLLHHLSSNPEDIKSFHNETRIAAKVKHPNVVQIFDAGQQDNIPYYVMEYVSGATIGELLEMRSNMEEEDALLITDKISAALEYCWKEHRLIHCDIKPENVIIDMQGNVKLTDLGLSRIRDLVRTELEDEETTLGTPSYMSPEQITGNEILDCRSDIYSLGTMLYHTLTGKRIFGELSDEEILAGHLESTEKDVIEINPSVSHSFAWMLEKMLMKDSNMRYEDWGALRKDLEPVRSGKMILGPPLPFKASTMERSPTRMIPESSTAPLAYDVTQPIQAIPKTKIYVTRTGKKKLPQRPAKKQMDSNRAMLQMILLLILVVILYGGTFIYPYLKNAGNNSSSSLPTFVKNQDNTTNASTVKTKPTPSVQPPKELPEENKTSTNTTASEETKVELEKQHSSEDPPETSNPPSWNNSDFQEAQKLFQEATRSYQKFTEDQENPEILDHIDRLCHTAIKKFESCNSLAPENINISTYIRQCYQLIANARWSKQLLD